MITIAIQCCLATFELLLIATVFVLSRIYFLGALLIDVICMKTKKIFYRPFFPVKNAELPGRWDLEGWREFRIQYIEKNQIRKTSCAKPRDQKCIEASSSINRRKW